MISLKENNTTIMNILDSTRRSNSEETTPLLLKPLLAGLCALGLLSGCAQLPSASKSDTSTHLSALQGSLAPSLDSSDKPTDLTTQTAKVSVTNDHPWLEESKLTALQHDNLWDDIASKLVMGDQHLEDFESYLAFYLRNHRHLERVSERAKPYLHYIVSEVKKRNMPYEIALLPIIESGFKPEARSHQRAVGLWQFIPQTGHLYGLDQNWWYDGRQDVVQSTEAALNYLQKLYELNDNDWLLALASYNGGIGNVWKAVKRYQRKHPENKTPDFWQIRRYLPKETQHYVPQLLAVSHLVKNRGQYEVQLEPIDNKPYFEVVELEKQVALNTVASLSDTPRELFSKLNPGYLRPATPPNGPFHIVLPLENHQQFQSKLNDKALFDIHWKKHKIKSGDTLSEIAQQYQTSTRAIQKLNHMKDHNIRIGKTLLIPVPQQFVPQLAQNEQKSQYTGPKLYHSVKSGESLWTIARYYNTDTKTLCDWNRIRADQPLRKGQKLAIHSDQYGYQTHYVLKKNESLWVVAQKFGVTTQELSRWNKIKRNQVLQPGIKLTIWQPRGKQAAGYRQYVVKSGDSLWNIARANNLSTKTIARYNQMTEKEYLKPGQVLKIPYDQET
ncbi:LysM peptidoglycan-binding domain-containing protein [Thiomicrorhabdus chilensis]|uniref:LysM peptidoglycan-binding domain-containing protein n=1 Tax=Thiomicrorhabdus chilensis TaxID=63656 RepID=UPI00299D7C65|nr:LysM peptidoglycan-binding domain-containing protein [Thiomicrorhabdus chilensis]